MRFFFSCTTSYYVTKLRHLKAHFIAQALLDALACLCAANFSLIILPLSQIKCKSQTLREALVKADKSISTAAVQRHAKPELAARYALIIGEDADWLELAPDGVEGHAAASHPAPRVGAGGLVQQLPRLAVDELLQLGMVAALSSGPSGPAEGALHGTARLLACACHYKKRLLDSNVKYAYMQ